MFKKTLAILFLVQFLQINGVVCQQNGDVRLNHFGDYYTNNGILEVFLTETNEWVPVCYEQFNDGAAAAACRQLGYCIHNSYRSGKNYKSDSDSEQSYTNVSCSDQSNYKDHGPLHLLRCQGNIQQQKCSQDPVYLVCGSQVDTPGSTCFINTDNPYIGQIYLYNDTSYLNSSGTLYLYYDNEWLPVCARSFNQYATDSACRQLGYTNGGYEEIGSSSSWDIDTITCKNNSYSCLKSCSSVPLYNQYCPNYKITCTFNTANKGTYSSGSKPECAYSTPSTTSTNVSGYIAGLIVFGTSFFIFFVLTIILGIFLVRKLKRPDRCNYEHINDHRCFCCHM